MKELRPHLADAADLVERVRRQRAEGYRLVGSFDAGGSVVVVAGFRCGQNLAAGRYLYVDDLVAQSAARRQGHASALLRWLDDEARQLGFPEVHLDSASHRRAPACRTRATNRRGSGSVPTCTASASGWMDA